MAFASDRPISARRFELARISELTFGLVRRDFWMTYGLVFLLYLLPTAMPMLLFKSLGGGLNQAARIQAASPWFMLIGFVDLFLIVIVYGALSWRAVERLDGRAPTIGQALGRAARAFPVLLGATLLADIGFVIAAAVVALLLFFGLGSMLGPTGRPLAGVVAGLVIIVGLLALVARWCVLLPAAVVERTGVIGSFSRSQELTRGRRWGLLLLFFVFFFVSGLASMLIAVLVRALLGAGSLLVMAQPVGPLAIVGVAVQLAVNSLVNLVGATGLGVVFYELRALKGGFDARRLSDVFG